MLLTLTTILRTAFSRVSLSGWSIKALPMSVHDRAGMLGTGPESDVRPNQPQPSCSQPARKQGRQLISERRKIREPLITIQLIHKIVKWFLENRLQISLTLSDGATVRILTATHRCYFYGCRLYQKLDGLLTSGDLIGLASDCTDQIWHLP
jgi:hypothetical protein